MRQWLQRVRSRIRWRLLALAYPTYDCQQCVGQEPWQGCYCAYHDCIAPCTQPTRWYRFLQWLIRKPKPYEDDT